MSVSETDILKPRYANRVVIIPPLGPESIDTSGPMTFDTLECDDLITPWIHTDAGDITIEPGSGVLLVEGEIQATGDLTCEDIALTGSDISAPGDINILPGSRKLNVDGDLYCEDIFMSGSTITAPGSLFFDLGAGGTATFDGDLVGPNLLLTSATPTISTNAGGLRLAGMGGTVTLIKSPTVNCEFDMSGAGDLEIHTSDLVAGKFWFNDSQVYPLLLRGPNLTLTGADPVIFSESAGIKINSFGGTMTFVRSGALATTTLTTDAGTLTLNSFGNAVRTPNTFYCRTLGSESGQDLAISTASTDIKLYSGSGLSVKLDAGAKSMRLSGTEIILDSKLTAGTAGIHPFNTATGLYITNTGDMQFEAVLNTSEWTVNTFAGAPAFGVVNTITDGDSKYVSVYATQTAFNSTSGAFQCVGGMSCQRDFFAGGSIMTNGAFKNYLSSNSTRNSTMSVTALGGFQISNTSTTGDGYVRIASAAAIPDSKIELQSPVISNYNINFTSLGGGVQFASNSDVLSAYYAPERFTVYLGGAFADPVPADPNDTTNQALWDVYVGRIGDFISMSWTKAIAVGNGTAGITAIIPPNKALPTRFRPLVDAKAQTTVWAGLTATWSMATVVLKTTGIIEVFYQDMDVWPGGAGKYYMYADSVIFHVTQPFN